MTDGYKETSKCRWETGADITTAPDIYRSANSVHYTNRVDYPEGAHISNEPLYPTCDTIHNHEGNLEPG